MIKLGRTVLPINRKIYEHLNETSRDRAKAFFEDRTRAVPFQAWMEARFLQILDAVAGRKIASQVDPSLIQSVDFKRPQYLQVLDDLTNRHWQHLEGLGADALRQGFAMAIDLAGGMATGFGGNVAKAVVPAVLDARYSETKEVSYLDLKRSNYLDLQRKYERHFIAAEMVSDSTQADVIQGLEKFAQDHAMELIIIMPGTPKEEIIKIWQENQARSKEAIIVPLINQPSMLYIDSQGKEVGKEYQKGHGDFFDVVKSQLEDVMEVMGIKYCFSSNIDNTGALVEEVLLGYFVEQVTQRRIAAIMEVAEKYEGDKGGVPALIDNVYSVLEGAFVPRQWQEAFAGRDIFPYFNTNSFWWQSQALLETAFNLPFMISKRERHEGSPHSWLKIESIMGHGLNQLDWKALAIDRGLRFHPAKFLTDLWVGRSDWMTLHQGRMIPRMCDRTWVRKPLMEVSKTILETVSNVDEKIYAGGSLDFMARSRTLVMGGLGKTFNLVGDLKTECRVSYEGDVAIIFGDKPGQPTGRLIIKGRRPEDTVVLHDAVIFVPPGEEVVLEHSVRGSVDARINPIEIDLLYNTAGAKWTRAQIERVVNRFASISGESSGNIDFGEFTSRYQKELKFSTIMREVRKQLDPQHQRELEILREVFVVRGSLVYAVDFRAVEGSEDQHPYLHVHEGSKTGVAADYSSRAEREWVPARDEKASTIIAKNGRLKIYINPVETAKGESFKGLHYLAIPHLHATGAEILLYFGDFDETINAGRKEELFSNKLHSLKMHAVEGREYSNELDDLVVEAFKSIPYRDLFELSVPQLFNTYIEPNLPEKERISSPDISQ
jgi:hypothetical protein